MQAIKRVYISRRKQNRTCVQQQQHMNIYRNWMNEYKLNEYESYAIYIDMSTGGL